MWACGGTSSWGHKRHPEGVARIGKTEDTGQLARVWRSWNSPASQRFQRAIRQDLASSTEAYPRAPVHSGHSVHRNALAPWPRDAYTKVHGSLFLAAQTWKRPKRPATGWGGDGGKSWMFCFSGFYPWGSGSSLCWDTSRSRRHRVERRK